MIHIITTGAKPVPLLSLWQIEMCTNIHCLRFTLCGPFPLRATWLAHWMIVPMRLSRTRAQLGDLHPTSFSHGSFPVSPIHAIPIHFCRSALTMINSALDIKRLISSHSCQPGRKRNETKPDKSEVWELNFRVFVKSNWGQESKHEGQVRMQFNLNCVYCSNSWFMASDCSCCLQVGYVFKQAVFYFIY